MASILMSVRLHAGQDHSHAGAYGWPLNHLPQTSTLLLWWCLQLWWCLVAVAIGDDIKEQAGRLKQEQLQVAQQLADEFPQSFLAYQVLANVHKTQGNQQAFLECLQRCAQLDPKRSDVHEQLGIQTLTLEDYQAAIRHFRQSLSLKPNVAVQVRLADALRQVGDTDEAQRILTAVAGHDPTGKASYLLGELLFQQRHWTGAKTAYERALKNQPNHLHALYGMVKVSTQLGDVEAAEEYSAKFEQVQSVVAALNQQQRSTYDDLTELRRHAAQSFTDAGRVYHAQDQTAAAEQLWRRAAAADSRHIACRALLARHYEATKQYQRTIPLYQALIELQPQHLPHYERLGIRLASNGDFAGAERTFQAMTKVPPNAARGNRMLAKLYLNSDRQLEQALLLAKQSVKIDPVADSHFVLGWALAKSNQFTAARTALQRALELDRDNALYKKLYRSLPPGG